MEVQCILFQVKETSFYRRKRAMDVTVRITKEATPQKIHFKRPFS